MPWGQSYDWKIQHSRRRGSLVKTSLTFSRRRTALALILGAWSGIPIAYLFLQTHGPYEEALNQFVWGLDHHDYSRLAVFPALLILPGVGAFHLMRQQFYERAGLWGYRLFFSGLALAILGQIWDYVLFDPWRHPMHGIGFMTQLLAILLMTIGLPLWAFANFRTLSSWQLVIPVLWVLFIVGLLWSIFTNEEAWMYPRYGIDGSLVADAVMAVASSLMAAALWKNEDAS